LQIPAYTRADARFEWKLTPRLSATVRGQNLFSRSHVEFAGSEQNVVTTRVPRSAGFQLAWQF
jgi:outer membrane receptor protein involved in Fe transport